MTTERAPQTNASQQTTSPLEQVPLEQIPLTGQSLQSMQQLQRLVGNRRTQQLMTQSVVSPHVQRAPGLPSLRGVLQRDDVPGAVAPDTAAAPDAARSTSSAAAAYAAVPESDITLTDVEIRQAINFNLGRYQGRSIPALRRYLQLPEGTTFDAAMIRAIARYQRHFALGTDGMLGRTTYDHIDLHQMLEQTVSGTPGTESDLIFSINTSLEGIHWDFTPMPSNPAQMRFRIINHFNVEVLLPEHAHPSEFRYRQMIKGSFTAVNGAANQDLSTFFSHIPGGRLPADFSEDGNTTWTNGVFYGRRTDAGQPTATTTLAQNQYFGSDGSPDQRNGHRYLSSDGPTSTVQNLPIGTTLRLNMEFLGQVVRISNGQVMQQKHWASFDNYTDVVPATASAG